MKLADAHVHFFRGGYRRPGLPSLFGDGELRAYEALREAHDIELALAIGYEGEGIDPDNNAYLRQLSQSRSWLRTLAFVETNAPPDPTAIAALIDGGHAGLAIYALDKEHAECVRRWPSQCWRLLQSRGAIVSFNSRPEAIGVLAPLTAELADIRFLFSHLGLPGVIAADTSSQAIGDRLKPLLRLALQPNVHVKISGAYATSQPPYAYPHGTAHNAIRMILDAFGPARCLWASDFAPALEFVSFCQTLDWPGSKDITEAERRMIFRDNLIRLLSGA